MRFISWDLDGKCTQDDFQGGIARSLDCPRNIRSEYERIITCCYDKYYESLLGRVNVDPSLADDIDFPPFRRDNEWIALEEFDNMHVVNGSYEKVVS
jgi:hypothetical protein